MFGGAFASFKPYHTTLGENRNNPIGTQFYGLLQEPVPTLTLADAGVEVNRTGWPRRLGKIPVRHKRHRPLRYGLDKVPAPTSLSVKAFDRFSGLGAQYSRQMLGFVSTQNQFGCNQLVTGTVMSMHSCSIVDFPGLGKQKPQSGNNYP